MRETLPIFAAVYLMMAQALAQQEEALSISSSIPANSDWVMPRTEHGAPDFQGTWFFGSRTPLQRPKELGNKANYSPQEVAELEAGMQQRLDMQAEPLSPDRDAPEAGAQIRQEADDAFLAHYQEAKILPVGGEYRTSVIVDPPDGRIPMRMNRGMGQMGMASSGPGPMDGPEGQPLSGRCLAFGSAIPNLTPMMMNPNMIIVQNEDYVMIMTEMVHDARIIRLNKEHFDHGIRQWMGDSVGYWDGDTLVVHSKGFRPEQSGGMMSVAVSDHTRITERYTLSSEDTIHYAFTVTDDSLYTQPFTGERTLRRNAPEERVYDFECHEGNYSLSAILRGARVQEVEAELSSTE